MGLSHQRSSKARTVYLSCFKAEETVDHPNGASDQLVSGELNWE